ncbi:MAG: hypothetical protein K940chlam8_00424 [Chlamydiae bacterium]|nr:hypothetical protein [Chlamydiota bacterium]
MSEDLIGAVVIGIFLVIRGLIWFAKRKKKQPTKTSQETKLENIFDEKKTKKLFDYFEEESIEDQIEPVLEKKIVKSIQPPPLPPVPEKMQKNPLQKYVIFHEILKKPKSLESETDA